MPTLSHAAAALGRKGGKSKSPKKLAALKANRAKRWPKPRKPPKDMAT